MNPIRAELSVHQTHPRGFALIVTLSLMILLTVVAVGLLSLSTISLRTSSQGDAMQMARANARMALMLAIGDLQKHLGPDTRISATADQVPSSDPAVSTSPKTQRQWAGAYQSWPTAAPNAVRPTPEFLQWFVSGDPSKLNKKEYAATAISAGTKDSVEIVTLNSVGATGDPVRVPLLTQTAANGVRNSCAWWVSDLNTKALMAPAKALPTAIADTRADQQSAPAFNLKSAVTSEGAVKPFSTLSGTDPRLPNIVSWQSSALLADKPENIRGLFHDFTPQSRGLLTNVRKGGFRQDLSMHLERLTSNAPQPTGANILYTVNGETGINMHELWSYYNLYSTSITANRGLRRTGGATFTTKGSISSGTPYLQLQGSPAECQADDWFYFKQPVITNYQLVLSFETRTVTVGSTTQKRLHLVADPILTFWNPLDVPVVVPTTAFFSVKYWQIPYTFSIAVNGTAPVDYPFAGIWRKQDEIDAGRSGDCNILSLRVGQAQQLVFKPGESIMVSQIGNSIVKGTNPVDHALVGRAGFNYGGGVSVPVRDTAGNYVTLNDASSITVRCRPNNLTAGATPNSGFEVMGPSHSRHFSLTHHEYFIGNDRGSNTESLGIGGMAIDWDFGNRRLKPSENRGTSNPGIAGTKPKESRLYAEKFKHIFKEITVRPLSAPLLGTKQPFMMVSYRAKTETDSARGSRSLARFNPKALFVDFFDLSELELDALPYEYSVESLDGWKGPNLELNADGGAYFGAAMNAEDGSRFVTTHSVPREPIVSLAAFQHSFANGFDIQKPKHGYAALNSREPLLPQISHAIGNSMASPLIPKDSTQATLSGGRPLADHSYLANQALWDDWFLSGIAPQNINTFGKSRTQRIVASEFFAGKADLPVARYRPDLRGKDPAKVTTTYFASAIPNAAATAQIASLIQVDGMFNVNSTSVEAWKSLLGSRKERPVLIRSDIGRESIEPGDETTPVSGLLGPTNDVAEDNDDLSAPGQWIGRRTLTDEEIDKLAREIVKEVRKRGPFLCLADFVNRRVGTDAELARAGAIQSALDSDEAGINEAYQSGGRQTTAGSNFTFPDAESGAISQGIPGIVKQADILTPIAPILSARSDSFLVRGYGEKTDPTGKVIARAWCEAVVQRSAEFVDPTDTAEKIYTSITTLNKTFGRRFEIVSFRWLNSDEA